MNKAYQLLLDVYPLLETYPNHEAENLVARIRTVLTDLALEKETDGKVSELLLLLDISKDLGYLEPIIYAFLEKKVEEL